MRITVRQLAPLVALILAGAIAWYQGSDFADRAAIDSAFDAGQSDVAVRDSGRVIRILADDNDGSRHQRFIVEIDSGLTVLVAHNIDIAPRINGLRKGDVVEFRGEYEWNDRGGVIHWTHHDPRGYRAGGWIEHGGRRYE